MTWVLIYLAIGLLNVVQFSFRGGFSSAVEVLFYLLLWPLQLLFAVFAYIIVPIVNWFGERILP